MCAKSTPGSNPGFSEAFMSKESHLVFARKYRPQKFSEVIHQELAINALKNALKTNRVGHAYIFFGARGVGKTTIARILAKRLNCETPDENEPCNQCSSCLEIIKGISNDVIEIDAASNRGIDNIRDLRENVKFSPMGGKYKIYIIDEVHMLTDQSFNALLKTLEEPPPHVVFILATTEFHKIPETILSRCQDFVFRKVPLLQLQGYVEELCKIEKIEYDMEGIFWIAKKGDGSVRDTLSFLEQAVTFTDGKIFGEKIGKMIGYAGVEVQIDLLNSILKEETFAKTFSILEKLYTEGVDLIKFLWEFLEFTYASNLIKENLGDKESFNYPNEDILKIEKAIGDIRLETLLLISDKVYTIYEKINMLRLRNSFEMKVYLEISFRKLIVEINKPSVSGVLEKIQNLKQALEKSTVNFSSGKELEKPLQEKKENETDSKESSEEMNIDLVSEIKDKFSGSEVDNPKFQELK